MTQTQPRSLWGFNRQQRLIIRHRRHKKWAGHPLLVSAVAGSGKTRVLVEYVDRLLAAGTPPQQILVTSFGNAAVDELRIRLRRNTSDLALTKRVQCVTLHAVAYQIVRRSASTVGLRSDFTIIAPEDSVQVLAKSIARDSMMEILPPAERCQELISLRANGVTFHGKTFGGADSVDEKRNVALTRLVKRYDCLKRKMNVVDFDDLLIFGRSILASINCRMSDKFDHFVIDEFQDLTRLQFEFVRALQPSGAHVVAFGDKAQVIGSFRGASIDNFQGFIGAYPLQTRVLRMNRNYRSTGSILDACNENLRRSRSLAHVPMRATKRYGSRPRLIDVHHATAAARFVANEILSAKAAGKRSSSIAVLARTASDLDSIIKELRGVSVPIRLRGGTRSTGELSDAIVDLLNWCENPRQTLAGARALRIFVGLNAEELSRVVSAARKRRSLKALGNVSIGKQIAQHWISFLRLVSVLQKSQWPEQIPAILRFQSLTQPVGTTNPSLRESIVVRRKAANAKSRLDFLAEMSLQRIDEKAEHKDDHVTLSTIHSAKGGEWDTVYIINAADGALPSWRSTTPDQIEEERRVFHVAMSRAIRRLAICIPKRSRNIGSGRIDTARSRFITRDMIANFEVVKVKRCPPVGGVDSGDDSSYIFCSEASSRAKPSQIQSAA